MSLGQGTRVVDGQRNLFPTSFAYNATSYGNPQVTGIPQVSPTMPPFLGGNAGGNVGVGGAVQVGGYGTSDNNAQVTSVANAHPHNLKVSPVWWAVGSLLLGLLLLQGVHWRKTILEGDEGVRVGAASERASAEA